MSTFWQDIIYSTYILGKGKTNFSPITLLANDDFFKVASPRSPILTKPVVPLMKMLSHLRSRWMIGGVLVCKKSKPLRICRLQLFRIFSLTPLKRFRYLEKTKWWEFMSKQGITNVKENRCWHHSKPVAYQYIFVDKYFTKTLLPAFQLWCTNLHNWTSYTAAYLDQLYSF